eukprot:scaffold124146_cov65-Attheya_sp.AAC.1
MLVGSVIVCVSNMTSEHIWRQEDIISKTYQGTLAASRDVTGTGLLAAGSGQGAAPRSICPLLEWLSRKAVDIYK